MKLKKIISIFLAIFIALAVSGCSTQPKAHSKKFGDIKGSWTYDSVYINSTSKKINKNTKTDIEISDGSIKQTYRDKKGKTSEKTFSVSGVSDGSFTLDKDGTSYDYQFDYDPGSQVLHFYYEKSGKQYHEVYQKYKEEIETSESKQKGNENNNAK